MYTWMSLFGGRLYPAPSARGIIDLSFWGQAPRSVIREEACDAITRQVTAVLGQDGARQSHNMEGSYDGGCKNRSLLIETYEAQSDTSLAWGTKGGLLGRG